MPTNPHPDQPPPREGYIPVGNARLYYRDLGLNAKQNRRPIVVLHGGPDFDHTYLLPDLDLLLSPSFRLIYYDQRGRGNSAANVRPEDVTIRSDVEDIERLRLFFHLDSFALLGHSWGGTLALEYATRYPDHLSHLILLNTAPASHDDFMLLRHSWRTLRDSADLEKLKARASDPLYQQGDPNTVAYYYRFHFRPTVRPPHLLDEILRRLRSSFTQEGILKARAIEDRLVEQTWLLDDYNLLPALKRLTTPTLVIHGDYDFIPPECALHVAQAIPNARFVMLNDCGHFSYLECPDEVRKVIIDFFQST
jgi:proline iminopeptidase